MTLFSTLVLRCPAVSALCRPASLPRLTTAAACLSTSRPQFRSNKPDAVNPRAVKLFTKDESRDFMGVFPDLVRELTLEGPYKDMAGVSKHLAQCIQYNVPNGKKNRGMAVPISYKLLASKSEITEENVRLANILGWCVEFLQAFFLITDDIMDGSPMRRGQPAWHTKEDIGLNALNDAILLETCIYTLLDTYFKDKPYYNNILHDFHMVTRHTCMGQALDVLTPKQRTADGRIDIEAYDMKTYTSIVKYKTSYYTFCLPGFLAMNMVGINDTHIRHQAKNIYLEMGRFFQVQDDFLDCFGDPKVTGKVGTDIQDGKCSWLIAMAMQRANKEQKDVLKECYGSPDAAKVAKVKQVYEDINLRKVYNKFEVSLHEDILLFVKQIKGEGQILPPKLFTTFLERIFKRTQ